jgi:DNA-binding IclR family transcriptional regulator
LTHFNYLERDPRTRKYRLGMKLIEMGLSAMEEMSLPRVAQPIIDELSERVNESVNLAVRHESEVVYIGQSSTNRLVTFFTRLGQRAPLYCTGVGKAMMASMRATTVRNLVGDGEWTRFTPNSVGNWEELEKELAAIHQRGYAIDMEEREIGVACVAASILDASGVVLGALSISGPSGRILPKTESLALEVQNAAARISSRLGYTAIA